VVDLADELIDAEKKTGDFAEDRLTRVHHEARAYRTLQPILNAAMSQSGEVGTDLAAYLKTSPSLAYWLKHWQASQAMWLVSDINAADLDDPQPGTVIAGRIEADNLGEPFKLGALLMMQVLELDAQVSIGTLYILDDGSDVAIVRLQGESPDLWMGELRVTVERAVERGWVILEGMGKLLERKAALTDEGRRLARKGR
jgi:hypothetical protein